MIIRATGSKQRRAKQPFWNKSINLKTTCQLRPSTGLIPGKAIPESSVNLSP